MQFLNNKLVIVGIALVVIIGVPIGIILPSLRSIEELSASIYREYEYLEQRRQQGFNIKKLQTEYEASRIHEETLRAMALEPSAELSFITHIEDIADSLNMQHQMQLHLDQRTPLGPVTALPFTITTTCTYATCLSFLSQLDQLTEVTQVKNIRLGKATNATGGATVSMLLSGEVYQHNAPVQP